MHDYIRIALLNDFVFCSKSIYFHQLYENYDEKVYKDTPQVEWSHAHESIDQKKYMTSKHIIESMRVFSEQYQLLGKIDVYNAKTKTLTERKNHIHKVYDGYKYQLYAQYFCMIEMWYAVENLTLYSMKDNIKYAIPLPDESETAKFSKLITRIKHFRPDDPHFYQNPNKCQQCIYRELCDYYLRQH